MNNRQIMIAPRVIMTGALSAMLCFAAWVPFAAQAATIDGHCVKMRVDAYDNGTFSVNEVEVEVDGKEYNYALSGAPRTTVTEEEIEAAVSDALSQVGKPDGFALYYPGTLEHSTDSEGQVITFEYKYDQNTFSDFEIRLEGRNDVHRETTTCDPLGIKIDKDDADNTDDTQSVIKNADATFTITVTNIGDIELKDVTVTDTLVPACDKNVGNLDPGESYEYTCTHDGVEAAYTNSASVIGTSTISTDTVTDIDTTKVTVPAPTCGDGNVDSGETCDDGNTKNGDGCSSACSVEPVCGNAKVETGETCDDGNTKNGDGCSGVCAVEPICGNGTVEKGEACDDKNLQNGDGCSSTCQVEKDASGTTTTPAGETCDASDYADIKGYVYIDENRNDEYDKGEEGIEDVKVELKDENGDVIDEDDTNDDGRFRFENYAPGEYTIDLHRRDGDLKGYVLVAEPGALNGKDDADLKCDNDHTGTNFGFAPEEKKVYKEATIRTLAKTGGDTSFVARLIMWLF